MTPAFRHWVDRARGEHVNAILSARQIKLMGRGNRRAGPCPKCGGEDRFAVDLEKQIFNCRGCGAKGHGAISLVMALDDVSFVQAVEIITGEPPPKDDAPKTHKGKSKPRGKFSCAYDYTDEHDALGYQVCRYADPKSFSQRRPDPVHPPAKNIAARPNVSRGARVGVGRTVRHLPPRTPVQRARIRAPVGAQSGRGAPRQWAPRFPFRVRRLEPA